MLANFVCQKLARLLLRRLNLLSLVVFCLTARGAEPLPLTKVGQVHDLPPAVAARHLPVHLLATVTYYEPSETTLFIADATGAVYVKTTHPYRLHRGDLVQVDGYTAKSFRSTVAADPTIRVLGKGSLTRARVPDDRTYQELMAGRWDCQYVVMHGIVRSALVERHDAGRVLQLELLMPGGLVQGYVQDYRNLDPDKLIDAEVQFSGIVGGDFNAQWQLMRPILYGADANDLKVLRYPTVRPSSLPLTSIGDVMQTHSVLDQSQRVRVRGAVTFYRPGHAVVIQQGGHSLYATTRESKAIALGTVVDLIGFADDGGYGPAMGQAEILSTGQFNQVEPKPVSYAQAIRGDDSDNLVALQGQIVSQLHTDASDTLTLMVDKHPVTVVLQSSDASARLPKLPSGTAVAVSGICRITPTGIWSSPGTTPMLFRIDMRSGDDLRIISWPSWWNLEHVLILSGAMLAILLLIVVWAIVLRTKVAKQTARIASTMRLEQERSRLLEAINAETPLYQLLADICSAFERLAPGLVCCCAITGSPDQDSQWELVCVGNPPTQVAFDVALTDPRGRHIGNCNAGRRDEAPLSTYELELVTVASSLANLAINQRRLYEELNYSSSHDQLTGLPNRRSADLSLETALREATRTGRPVGVAYIDVDRFKQVNDQHGHKLGDLYLQQIAQRLASVVRSTDSLARIGGDEFLLVATALHSREDAELYRERLQSCFASSFVLDGHRMLGSASIGLAVFPDHGQTAEELKRHADIDMYSVKHRRSAEAQQPPCGVMGTDIFTPTDLAEALKNDQFRLFYQPQFSSTGELKGLEALIRLQDPILGTVSPDAFIGTAERNDLIHDLGMWVLREALADATRWQLHELPDARMVVNVSARQLENPHFAHEVLAVIEEFGLHSGILELEITERTLICDLTNATQQLHILHARGVHIAIDDFGTEYSCLSRLYNLPIDTLKIDRSFLRALRTNPEVSHIIEAVVALAHTMRKRIVVEGVETEEELGLLSKLGDLDLQGFLFSRPQPAETIASHMQSWRLGIAVPGKTLRPVPHRSPKYRNAGPVH